MNIATFTYYIVIFGLGISIILTMIIYTTKFILAQEMQKTITSLQAEAEKTTAKALEGFRQGLVQQIALQESRTNTLGRLYSLIVEVQRSGQPYMHQDDGGMSKEAILLSIQGKYKSFMEYHKEHEIFFSDELCRNIEMYIKNVDEVIKNLKAKTSTKPIDIAEKKDLQLVIQKNWVVLEDYSTKLMTEMKKEFAQITGQTERLVTW